MVLFGELLGRGMLGDLRILRAHLRDIYDFAFLQTAEVSTTSVPSAGLADTLRQEGRAILNGSHYQRYGIGEFKALGESIFDDFDPAEPRKAPDTPDLLVCWRFDTAVVEDGPWTVEALAGDERVRQPDTHLATHPRRGGARRALPVISLETFLEQQVATGAMAAPPAPWPQLLPDVYY